MPAAVPEVRRNRSPLVEPVHRLLPATDQVAAEGFVPHRSTGTWRRRRSRPRARRTTSAASRGGSGFARRRDLRFRTPCTGTSRTTGRGLPSCVHFGRARDGASGLFGTDGIRDEFGVTAAPFASSRRMRNPRAFRIPFPWNRGVKGKGPRSAGTKLVITRNREYTPRGGRAAKRGRSSWSSSPYS